MVSLAQTSFAEIPQAADSEKVRAVTTACERGRIGIKPASCPRHAARMHASVGREVAFPEERVGSGVRVGRQVVAVKEGERAIQW